MLNFKDTVKNILVFIFHSIDSSNNWDIIFQADKFHLESIVGIRWCSHRFGFEHKTMGIFVQVAALNLHMYGPCMDHNIRKVLHLNCIELDLCEYFVGTKANSVK